MSDEQDQPYCFARGGAQSGPVPAALDELLAALVRKLPAPGKPFPGEARDAWLKMMAMAFDVAYGSADSVLTFPHRPNGPYREEFTLGKPAEVAIAPKAPAGPPRFYIAKDGRALKDPGAKPVTVNDVPTDEVIYDERPMGQRSLDEIHWADGNWPAAALPPLNFN